MGRIKRELLGIWSFKMSSAREIVYLSPPAKVSMADRWYDIASVDHFWMRRRFEVLQRIAGHTISEAHELAEIGCGSGLLQRQIEDRYNRQITGFDLNEYALKQNVSQRSEVCCYDIYEKNPSLRCKFDVILLFDVLEHIADEDRFLEALKHHLAPAGYLVANVPAGQWAYSEYDRAAGHVRRYSIRSLRETARRNRFSAVNWSYWGLPLLPPLMLRKLWLSGQRDESKVISAGFDSRTEVINRSFRLLSKCEPIPQKLAGSSLMSVFQLGAG
ncbi:MAG: class I SAM-dependent methyltransferase [Candidatus Acidiferrales bacterium]